MSQTEILEVKTEDKNMEYIKKVEKELQDKVEPNIFETVKKISSTQAKSNFFIGAKSFIIKIFKILSKLYVFIILTAVYILNGYQPVLGRYIQKQEKIPSMSLNFFANLFTLILWLIVYFALKIVFFQNTLKKCKNKIESYKNSLNIASNIFKKKKKAMIETKDFDEDSAPQDQSFSFKWILFCTIVTSFFLFVFIFVRFTKSAANLYASKFTSAVYVQLISITSPIFVSSLNVITSLFARIIASIRSQKEGTIINNQINQIKQAKQTKQSVQAIASSNSNNSSTDSQSAYSKLQDIELENIPMIQQQDTYSDTSIMNSASMDFTSGTISNSSSNISFYENPSVQILQNTIPSELNSNQYFEVPSIKFIGIKDIENYSDKNITQNLHSDIIIENIDSIDSHPINNNSDNKEDNIEMKVDQFKKDESLKIGEIAKNELKHEETNHSIKPTDPNMLIVTEITPIVDTRRIFTIYMAISMLIVCIGGIIISLGSFSVDPDGKFTYGISLSLNGFKNPTENFIGIGFALYSNISNAIYSIIAASSTTSSKNSPNKFRMNVIDLSIFQAGILTVLFFFASLAMGEPIDLFFKLQARTWMYLILYSFLIYFVADSLILLAVKLVGSNNATALSPTSLLFTLMFSAIFLQEYISNVWQIIGCVIVMIGVIVFSIFKMIAVKRKYRQEKRKLMGLPPKKSWVWNILSRKFTKKVYNDEINFNMSSNETENENQKLDV